ncbi:MAG: 30S ribosomal protein S17 [Methanosarcinales archaeon]|nr:MAG: 30S ribosomal protein S17 [Methanosarcinales archaeon]
MARDIGLDVAAPKNECADINCPFHGTLPVRGQIIEGKVVSSKMDKTAVVQREFTKWNPKYGRYKKVRSKIHAHNPPCINAKDGDVVKIAECRPLSKTKKFVIIEVIKR